MSNNFDLRKFLTENKLTSVAKTITEATDFSNPYDFEFRKIDGDCYKIDPKTKEKSKVHHTYCKLPNNEETTLNEAAELSPIEQKLVNAVMGDVNEAIDLGKILNKVKLLASKGLLTVAMASAILASCGTAGSSDEIFKRELDNLKKVDSIENVQKTRIDSISNDIKSSPTTATIKEYEHHYRKVGGECRKYNDEGDYTVVSMQYCQYNEGEANEGERDQYTAADGGYVEVMGPDFDNGVDLIAKAWSEWKNGPATEPEDLGPARADVLTYIKSILRF